MHSPDDRAHVDSDTVDTPTGAADTLEACQRELAEKNDRLLRALAEADNIRRRAQRDREESVRFAADSALTDYVAAVVDPIGSVQCPTRRGFDQIIEVSE